MATNDRVTPVRIGVISDTHLRTLSEMPAPILTTLAKVDLIVHAGDFTERAVLEGLRTLGKVKAVSGNMDSSELKEMLPRKELFVVNGRTIGLTHGSGAPWGIAGRIRDMFPEVDIIIGPLGIVLAHAMMGEVTPKIATAVSASRAKKILLPLSQENVEIVGIAASPLPHLVEELIETLLVPMVRDQ